MNGMLGQRAAFSHISVCVGANRNQNLFAGERGMANGRQQNPEELTGSHCHDACKGSDSPETPVSA